MLLDGDDWRMTAGGWRIGEQDLDWRDRLGCPGLGMPRYQMTLFDSGAFPVSRSEDL